MEIKDVIILILLAILFKNKDCILNKTEPIIEEFNDTEANEDFEDKESDDLIDIEEVERRTDKNDSL